MYQAIKWAIQRISDEKFLDVELNEPSEGYSFYYSADPCYFLDTEYDASFTKLDLPDPENHRIVKLHLTIYKAL